jgi:hypothetical protein
MNTVDTFTYVVTSTDEANGTMELTYSSPNLPDVSVGALMPRGSQTLDEVAMGFAPMRYWLDLLNPVVSVAVGASATVTSATPAEQAANAEMWAQVEFEKKLGKALVKFGVLQADPTEIPVSAP